MEVCQSSTLTLNDVLEMDGEILANLVIEKFLKHTPCKIRFRPKPRESLHGSLTMDDQTGILFGCKYTTDKRKPFEFGIYFKDPLHFGSDNKSVSLVERPHRHHKVFSGPSFVGTCYYNWDDHGTNKTMYKKDTYNFTEVQLIPENDSSWQKTTEVFPFAHRHWKSKECIFHFLVQSTNMPIKNEALIAYLSPVDCNPRRFRPIHGRSTLRGRGLATMINQKPESSTQKTLEHKRSRLEKSIQARSYADCPGCRRFIKITSDDNGYEADNSHQTQDCCQIQVCKVFFI